MYYLIYLKVKLHLTGLTCDQAPNHHNQRKNSQAVKKVWMNFCEKRKVIK